MLQIEQDMDNLSIVLQNQVVMDQIVSRVVDKVKNLSAVNKNTNMTTMATYDKIIDAIKKFESTDTGGIILVIGTIFSLIGGMFLFTRWVLH